MDKISKTTAKAIIDAFDLFHVRFKQYASRSKALFENRDWQGIQHDSYERLNLYKDIVDKIVEAVKEILKEKLQDRAMWRKIKEHYTELIAGRDDLELTETFFNSVSRRLFATVGVDPLIEYVDTGFKLPEVNHFDPIYRTYHRSDSTKALLKEILNDYQFNAAFQDIELDIKLAAECINAHLESNYGSKTIDAVEMIKPIFYRNKTAYIIGRIRRNGEIIPLLLPLHNKWDGIHVDAVLLTQDEVSVVFSFTRSYFHVDVDRPLELIDFLKSIMPLKPLSELYISLGYNKHGKTELYRDLLRYLESSDDKFETARGDKGMVMLVFTLPSYDKVFKIIKDRFAFPKNSTRKEVIEKYNLVFMHDRAGRLIDAQEFEHLEFSKDRFSDDLLKELTELAANSVFVEGDKVVIKHLYTERKLIPLNLFAKEASEEAAIEAVTDYGYAIKDLAAANIFPGDTLLKNFGVTRHGRVVFYDYDELRLLTDCCFREIPPPRDDYDELSSEPWYKVAEGDIFPEEFKTFLGLDGKLRKVFIRTHAELFGVEFWHRMQERMRAGEIIDIIPYKKEKRLRVKL